MAQQIATLLHTSPLRKQNMLLNTQENKASVIRHTIRNEIGTPCETCAHNSLLIFPFAVGSLQEQLVFML